MEKYKKKRMHLKWKQHGLTMSLTKQKQIKNTFFIILIYIYIYIFKLLQKSNFNLYIL